jgi:hypothetical protein
VSEVELQQYGWRVGVPVPQLKAATLEMDAARARMEKSCMFVVVDI